MQEEMIKRLKYSSMTKVIQSIKMGSRRHQKKFRSTVKSQVNGLIWKCNFRDQKM